MRCLSPPRRIQTRCIGDFSRGAGVPLRFAVTHTAPGQMPEARFSRVEANPIKAIRLRARRRVSQQKHAVERRSGLNGLPCFRFALASTKAAAAGLVLWKGRLGDAITAHAVTNFLLGLWVVWKGAWQFW